MGFFNMRSPRKFNHRPIFYDPDKEALEKRVEKVKREIGMADEKDYKPDIKGSFIDQTSHLRKKIDKDSQKPARSRNIRLAVVLVVLLILFYYFYMR